MALRLAVCCFVSAVLGAVVTVSLTSDWSRLVNAQDKRTRNSQPLDDPDDTIARPAAKPRVGPGAAGGARPLDQDELELTPDERVNVTVYETANRSVVHITTRTSKAEGLFLMEVPGEEAGSGSVVDNEGHILTNYHVIENAKQANVTLFDGKSYEAKFVGGDPINDIAIIKVDAPPESLKPVQFGDSSRLKVGMRVLAIGNPFGLERTLTTGVISSLNRTLPVNQSRSIKSVIQIDAAINPGNSGGPLLDTKGRLIGMNTAIATRTGQSAGVAFAIPVNLIARLVPQLIAKGRVTRPEIGVRLYEIDAGLLIVRLVPDGPAERAGLRGPQVVTKRRGPFVVETIDRSAADVIVALDGKRVKTTDDFHSHIESLTPGDEVSISVIRQGKVVAIPVIVSSDVELEKEGE